jgi:hypothetical protein
LSKIRLVDAEIFHYQYFEVVFQFRLSSMGGHLHVMHLLTLLWSYRLKFKIWTRSNQWLLRYTTINILRLSSNLGCLPWEVIFILCICKLCFGHITFSLKYEHDPISGCWDIPLSIFWGCLPIKVIFHGRSSSFYVFVKFALVM